jgi:hypothetical protein
MRSVVAGRAVGGIGRALPAEGILQGVGPGVAGLVAVCSVVAVVATALAAAGGLVRTGAVPLYGTVAAVVGCLLAVTGTATWGALSAASIPVRAFVTLVVVTCGTALSAGGVAAGAVLTRVGR